MKKRQAEGYKEIVITGVEVGSYNDNGIDLTELLERILEETDIPRLRPVLLAAAGDYSRIAQTLARPATLPPFPSIIAEWQ